ncbi:hypothetical protein ACHAWF_004796 [Thalassiosira exigua]
MVAHESTSSFCTMGGMHTSMHDIMTSNTGNGGVTVPLHRRKLLEAQWDSGNDSRGDRLPVIIPDDEMHGDKHSGHAHMHEKDSEGSEHHHHSSMNDDMNHEMNHDHSAHSTPHHMNMNQGTVMYMDGFHSALFSSSQPPPPCLVLFHPSWTLHTPGKFSFAMACIALMGALVEACGVWRVRCLRKGRSCRRDARMKRMRQWEAQREDDMSGQQLEFHRQSRALQQGVSDISDVSSHGDVTPHHRPTVAAANSVCPAFLRRMWRVAPMCIRTICARLCSCLIPTKNGNVLARRYDVAAACLHATRAALGYLLMLAVMTYAIEFLIAAALGMVVGRYWFVDSGNPSGGGGVLGGAVGVGGGIGGMGLGDGGRQNSTPEVNMADFQAGANDGTWGGGDPCCGIDDDENDDNSDHLDRVGSNMAEPLLSPLMGNNNARVHRRGGGGGNQVQ